MHHIVNSCADFGVLPIQIRLLGREKRKKMLVCGSIVRLGAIGFVQDLCLLGMLELDSGTYCKTGNLRYSEQWISKFVANRLSPYVPGAFWIVKRRIRLQKPGVLSLNQIKYEGQ